eukprot:CAMPEP_0172505272 /NCGR_PEP_ID=MMETSP1066-20121228/185065_1 /TAXON_ID=671091 /ORGANISM="Coscinodiscus wailesii, Strain CCMP2513" /LENGTH=242 /DNA_ID=CAMNT_0013281823 /DNA_START=276 /DNA_END=1004 /DNA_ORIENTATION=-
MRFLTSPAPLSPTDSALELTPNDFLDRIENLLIGGLFPDDSQSKGRKGDDYSPTKILACHELFSSPDATEATKAHDSLELYLRQWARMLQDDTDLTTPVLATSFLPKSPTTTGMETGDGEDFEESSAGRMTAMKVMFRPRKRYMSYNEQKAMEKGVMPDRKGAKLDSLSPGGIEIAVETVVVLASENNEEDFRQQKLRHDVRLVARRCGIDSDTVIKFTSERAVIRRMEGAMRVWRKMRAEY